MLRTLKLCALLAALTLLAIPARADTGIGDLRRFSLAAQVGYGWTTDADNQFGAEERQEPLAALVPAWSLGEFAAAVCTARLGFASQVLSLEPKFSVLLPLEAAQVSAWAGYRFLSDFDDDFPLEKDQESFVGASLVIPLRGKWALSTPVNYGLESHQTTVDLRLSCLLAEGGE